VLSSSALCSLLEKLGKSKEGRGKKCQIRIPLISLFTNWLVKSFLQNIDWKERDVFNCAKMVIFQDFFILEWSNITFFFEICHQNYFSKI